MTMPSGPVRPEEKELNVTKAPARIGSSPVRWTREPGRERPSQHGGIEVVAGRLGEHDRLHRVLPAVDP